MDQVIIPFRARVRRAQARKTAALAIALALLAATPAMAAGQGKVEGKITVADAVYGGMTTATVNPGGTNTYVFVQCYDPNGAYVYARYFAIDANNQAHVGPLWSTLWSNGPASCKAQEGYFKRDGFGRWVSLASTTFAVTAP